MRRTEAPEIVGQRVLAIVRHFGKPSLFITIITNPHWDDITRELLTDESGVRIQTWRDRQDLVARVFNFRLQEVLQELRRDNIFGRHVANVYTVEFQKRGLPHAYITS
jgi:helitron helicase-like protein